jgi:hypothetical protein
MDNPGEPPIFLGPIFIHDNSDFESYSNFFNHLRVKLISTDTSNLVIGCDEEYALVSSIQIFPGSRPYSLYTTFETKYKTQTYRRVHWQTR